ncbi:MAG: PTS transporter subunit EIIA [Lentisphaerae bacterium]|jgi:PTS system nitrogen regulatory IIA component|nr:PTS transporter subunit EIIA [Lentisphaerota bacterium]
MPYRVLNLAEAAEFLHMAEVEVEELARRGEIPCERHGPRLIFRHQELDEWASKRLLDLAEKPLRDFHRETTAHYHDLSADAEIIAKLIRPEWIEPALQSRTKASVIRDMVTLADRTGYVFYLSELHESLVEREKLCSTALTGGLALLHPRNHEPYMFEDSFVVLGKTVSQVPFGSPDGSTSDIFFLICCQDDRIHLHVLARLCMMCHQTSLLFEMRGLDDPKEIYRLLAESERQVIKQV